MFWRAISCVLCAFLLWGSFSPGWAQDAKLNALLTAVKADPKNPTARFNLGVEYFNRKQFDLAIPEFERVVKTNPKDKEAREFLESTRGIQAYLDKDYPKAAGFFRKTLEINPGNPNANQLIANAYLHMKDYAKAEKAYEAYLQAFPKDKEAVRIANQNLSKLYIDQSRYPEAERALKAQLEVDPGNFDAHNNLGVVYFYAKDYTNAARSWEKAVKIQKNPQTYKFLGFSYYNLGKFKEATSKYEEALRLEKDDPEVHYNLAVAYFDNAQYDMAAASFGEAVRLQPGDSNAATGQAQAIESAINSRMEKGSNHYLNNEYSQAISEWQGVLQYQKDHREAKAFIADAQGKMKDDVARRLRDAKRFEGQGRNADALRELNLALAMDPGNQEARSIVNRMKVKRSEKVGSFIEQGDDHLAGKDYASAIRQYRAALKVNAEDANAKTKLNKALGLQKQAFQLALDRGKKATASKDFKRAIQAYVDAGRIQPDNNQASALLFETRSRMRTYLKDLLADGEALFEAGQKDKAKVKFQAVVELDQDNAIANDYIKRMTGQQSQAKVDSEKVRALYYEGVNLYINGKIHEAIARWKDCLKLDPGHSNAQKNIDKAYVKLQSIQKLGQN
jgi:tetratricopeptide (TPR) repeat protein